MNLKNPSVNIEEVEKFSKIADEWWDEKGKFKPLHRINPLRLELIKQQAEKYFNKKKLNILDVGCGGGLVSIPLSLQGHDVLGLDASEKNIKVAGLQAKRMESSAKFTANTVENIVGKKNRYDIVLALEIVEHVENYQQFLKDCFSLVDDGGGLIVSTINRTMKSLLTAKLGAEYILRWLPVGTHSWNKFLKPEEIEDALNLKADNKIGMVFNPLTWSWSLQKDDLDVNYYLSFKK